MQHAPISRARYVQENRKMRFQEAYDGWSEGRLTQAEAALLLGQCERSFSRHIERFEADGLEGLLDKRLSQISKRRASGVEVDHVVQLHKSWHNTPETAKRPVPGRNVYSRTIFKPLICLSAAKVSNCPCRARARAPCLYQKETLLCFVFW